MTQEVIVLVSFNLKNVILGTVVRILLVFPTCRPQIYLIFLH